MPRRMLIVEDEETLRESLKRLFTKEEFEVETADSAEKGLKLSGLNLYDVIISDIILPGIDGIEMISRIREQTPDQIFIVITAYASLETALKALRAGAYDYVMKPIIHEEIKQIVRNALRQKSLQMENVLLKRQMQRQYDFSRIVGESASMKKIMEEIRKISDARSNVLVLGETGTGKELIARAIHFNSARAEKPFIPINCSAIPENLLESELFGHVKGAFTGAVSSKKGLFEIANGGTVFLDEIGDLGVGLQSKLLRVLEDQEIRPVGGTQSMKTDLRFITATNRDIENAVREEKFREDLLYRINVITIKIPPLRERREDIEPLAMHFVRKYAEDLGKDVRGLEESALQCLKKYNWPGNVRELQNIIERSLLIVEDGPIREDHLPENLKKEDPFFSGALDNRLSIEEYTKEFIKKYQDRFTEQAMADMLGITRKALWEKRKRWGMSRQN
ncbi:MAG: sigma-54 dependent transcriptional regulator [Nitrospiraceae bacterium]|nr:sigma-54 dependent transcriptional regulator [Nitrospiraceae bacterium]